MPFFLKIFQMTYALFEKIGSSIKYIHNYFENKNIIAYVQIKK